MNFSNSFADVGTLNTILLVVAALVPAVALGIYVYKKDKVEKEPVGLLLLLLLSGVLIVIPVLIVSIPMEAFLSLFESLPYNGFTIRFYNAIDAFLCVALVEEGFKWLALVLITRKNKNFNSLFDGLIYAVFVSLGFAAAENILYCISNGWATAITRAVLSVPGHVFDAVIMGYFYSLWYMTDYAAIVEKKFREQNIIVSTKETFSSRKYMILSLLMPVLAHGFYDYCCFMGTVLSTLTLYAFVIFLYIYSFRKIKKMSALDTGETSYVKWMLISKYPQLCDYFLNANKEQTS